MSQNAIEGGWTAWPAPAKLNLFLRIVGRRADGYHLLQTMFQLLDWGDRLLLRVRTDGKVTREASAGHAVAEAEDLTVRAALLLRSEANCDKGADIRIEKQIPMGGGFGGGSSDAATVLVALNRLWGCGLGVDRLAAMGLALGADVPVFVRGHSAWAEGVGERLSPLALPARHYLVVDSGVSVPTARLFQAPDLTRDAPTKTIADFLSDPHALGPEWGNAFEPVLRRLEPRIAAVLDGLAQWGPASLTGTGGGCFVAFATREAAERALSQLSPGLKGWVASGVAVSPLQAAVEHCSI